MGTASALERAGETAHALAYSGAAQVALQDECTRLRAQLGEAMARLVLHDRASPPRHLSPSAASPHGSPTALGSRSAPPGSGAGAVVAAAAADAPQLARELDASRRHLAEARAAKSTLRCSLAEADASLAALGAAAADEAEAARRGRTSRKPSKEALEGAGESGGAAQLAVAAARQAVHRAEKCQAALRDDVAALTRQLSEVNAERATERQRAAQQREALEVLLDRQLGARHAYEMPTESHEMSHVARMILPSIHPSIGLFIYLLHLYAPFVCIHRTFVRIHRTCVSKAQLSSTETSAAGPAEASALEKSAAEVAVTRQQLRAARREIDDLRGEITERRVGDERRAEAAATAAATAAAATAAAASARSPPRSPAEAWSSFGDEGARHASALTSRVQHLETQVEHEVLRAHEAAQRQHACEVQAHHASQMLGAMQATLQHEGVERGKLAASLSASHRQLETTQAALQSKELTIAKMRSRMGSSNANGALAQDMARLGYTLGLKST